MSPYPRSRFHTRHLLLILSVLACLPYRSAAALVTLTVTNTNDSEAGSLRQAILDANANPGPDMISFSIGGGGVHTINLSSGLPQVTGSVILDGTTQPGFAGSPLIELNGSNAGAGANGLFITAGGSTVRGLVINSFAANGILIDTAGGNAIEGNYIGTNAAGTTALANAGQGVRILSANNVVGGTTLAQRNLISGSPNLGLEIMGAVATNNRVLGNFIGTDVTGTAAIPNGGPGTLGAIAISAASNNIIGGTMSGAGNLISGNSGGGVIIRGTTASANQVQGNFIGVNAAGTAALGNTAQGVLIFEAPNNIIGGTQAGSRNVISGNKFSNVGITEAGATGNQVLGNFIGTTVGGDAAVSNPGNGVSISNGSANNIIGGTNVAARNVISGNGDFGITIDSGSTGNIVEGNFIGTDLTGTVAVGNTSDGIGIFNNAQNNTVGGTSTGSRNIISGNVRDGVLISFNATGNLVQGNYIGTDVTGTSVLSNNHGVVLRSPNNIVGGTVPGARNVVSGHRFHGFLLGDSGGTAINNLIQGNFIGLNAAGTAALPNTFGGVSIDAGSSNNTIGGTVPEARNIISGNGSGVLIGAGADSNKVQGNYIGTNPTGMATLSNGGDGIALFGGAHDNLIGGTIAGARNVISGNSTGVSISGSGPSSATANLVQGNFIGTNANGNSALPNSAGVSLSGVSGNFIGGTANGAGNVISGNSSVGISIFGGANGNLVQGNFVGTDASGNAALGNSGNGVGINDSNGNTIGGNSTSARNIISGNPGVAANGTGHGVVIGGNSTGNIIAGNYIGTNVSGLAAVANGRGGVFVFNGAANNTIGGVTNTPGVPPGNLISGNTLDGISIQGVFGSFGPANNNGVQGNLIGTNATGASALGNGFAGIRLSGNNNSVGGAGTENIISFNNSDGIFVSTGAGNALLNNSIFSNGSLGIRLTGNGNSNQPAPTLTSVLSAGGNTTIQGTFSGPANTAFNLQVFANNTCDPSGSGEGQVFFGSTSASSDASGNASFNATLPGSILPGQVVTATVTDATNNTSAFSQCRQLATGALKISGRIVEESAGGISGVTLILSGAASGSTTTDSNGNYAFTNLGAGNYTVTPSSSTRSFNPASHTFNDLAVDRIANFVGTRTIVSVTGRVTDANGVGISNVTLALTKNGIPAGITLTNTIGNYGFGNLTTGANYVVTPAGSFTPSGQSFSNLTVNAVANFTAAPSIPPQCNTISFGAATNLAVGTSPSSVAIGDFNTDGVSDLAVANADSNDISILLGTGTGTFTSATNFSVAPGPFSVTIGDFNTDGVSDLAVANLNSNNVSILLGTGTGSFGMATNFTVGTNPHSIVTGDFNGDSKGDLVTANGGSHNISILLGTGTGTFSAPTNFSVGLAPISLAIGDFNVDGMSDLAVATSGTDDISILLGTGTGGFGPATSFAVGTNPKAIAIGDFNHDGKSDIAVTFMGGSANVSIVLGTGTGSFSAANTFVATLGARDVAVGDFNGDGKNDLAVTSPGTGDVSILLGSGTGSFGSATIIASGGTTSFSGVIGDFNGDGRSDLAVANQSSANVSILLNNSATCNTQTSLSISGRIITANNNPLSDVAVTLSGPITRVVQTDVNGNYTFANLVPGGNYAVTVQSPFYVFAPSRVNFSNMSSDQVANFTAAPVVVPIPLPPPSDDFEATVRDANKWSLGTVTQSAGSFDPQVNVSQVNGQLTISPLTQASGLNYNGYVSANSFDMRGGSISVELVTPASGGADTIFAIGSDSDNFYRFMVHTAGAPTSLVNSVLRVDGVEGPLDATVAQLIFQVNVGGQLTALSIDYDPVRHRYKRFRHEAPTNSIVFETSPDNIDFDVKHRVTLVRSVSALTAELSAGTSNPANPGPAVFDNLSLVVSTFQFSSANYSIGEGDGSILITVTRSGSTTGTAAVDYATADGTASQTRRYINAAGRLTFAAGEGSKTFRVLVVDNVMAEGNENLNLLLQEPAASGLNTPGRAVLTIIDNDTTIATSNPLNEATFYVTQHYYDFLNREPDAGGLAFWVNEITSCGGEPTCLERKRINVSAAYFLSIEFQQTGYLVHRFYNLALNRANGLPRYLEFLRDTQAIGRGVVVGDPGYEVLLEANKLAYANEFTARAEFTGLYPVTLSAMAYVDALYGHAEITPGADERQAAIDEFITPDGARGRVLRRVAENRTLLDRESNRAFVLAQYFGYLRRNPNDLPDTDFGGYNFWLGKLNQFNGDFVGAEMVKAFITSGEYRQRFGP